MALSDIIAHAYTIINTRTEAEEEKNSLNHIFYTFLPLAG